MSINLTGQTKRLSCWAFGSVWFPALRSCSCTLTCGTQFGHNSWPWHKALTLITRENDLGEVWVTWLQEAAEPHASVALGGLIILGGLCLAQLQSQQSRQEQWTKGTIQQCAKLRSENWFGPVKPELGLLKLGFFLWIYYFALKWSDLKQGFATFRILQLSQLRRLLILNTAQRRFIHTSGLIEEYNLSQAKEIHIVRNARENGDC